MNHLFPLGHIVATPGAIAFLASISDTGAPEPEATKLLDRHVAGDWGEVDAEDAAANKDAIASDARILSAYTVADRRVWVITEADRRYTTIQLPEEY